MSHGLSAEAVAKIQGVFSRFPSIEKAVLYGSRAKGNYRAGSDIDLTLMGEALTPHQLGDIADQLDDLLLPYTIDLSHFETLNHAKLREHIERVGKLFYERQGSGKHQSAASQEGWEHKTIGEVCEVINGGTPKTGITEYWDGPHQWITPAEMGKRATPYIDQTERTITDAGMQNSSARLLPQQSVILSSRAPIGHLVINTVPMATNQGCKGLVPRNGLDSKYLYYYLAGIVPLLNDLGTGATFKELSGGKLKEVPVPVAPLPEQHRIVAILDEAFDGIATAKANAQKNLQNARALFESHLQSVFTERGEGWVEKRLLEVCEKITDGTHQTPTYFDEGVIFLSSRNVTSGMIDWENIKYIDTKQHLEMHRRVAPRVGDILLAKNGTTGVAAIVDRDVVFDIYVSLALLRSLGEVQPRFLLYFVNSPAAKHQFNKRLKGVGVPNLHLQEIREVVIGFPSDLAQQNAIVEQLDLLSAEIGHLESLYQHKLTALDDLKKSLLHQAFSGQL
jgi:type I restriction enzyme S subunit